MMRTANLTSVGATVRYGGVAAVKDVSISVTTGHTTALIGPNGAGKTSFLNALVGATKLSEGDVQFNGTSIRGLAPHRRVRLGIGRTFQTARLIPNLSVLENVGITSENSRGTTQMTPMEALDLVGMAHRAAEYPGELPYGNLRLIEIARSVAAGPSILLLDEPAAGLNVEETAELGVLIKRLSSELGIGVLVVEHDMRFVVSVADTAVVLVAGQLLTRGAPRDVVRDPAVIEAYLGSSIEADVENVEGNGA